MTPKYRLFEFVEVPDESQYLPDALLREWCGFNEIYNERFVMDPDELWKRISMTLKAVRKRKTETIERQTEDFSPGYYDGFSLHRRALSPKVAAVRSVGGQPEIVTGFEVRGQMLEVGVVRSCLQQQDGFAGVLRHAGCQNASRRTGPNDNVVVLHGRDPETMRSNIVFGCF